MKNNTEIYFLDIYKNSTPVSAIFFNIFIFDRKLKINASAMWQAPKNLNWFQNSNQFFCFFERYLVTEFVALVA